MKRVSEISVVAPVHNGGPGLGRCLDALLASDFAAREIIVVDDDSTDGSAAAAAGRDIEVLRLAARAAASTRLSPRPKTAKSATAGSRAGCNSRTRRRPSSATRTRSRSAPSGVSTSATGAARSASTARAARGAGNFRPERAFYAKLLRASLSHAGGAAALAPPALLLWAQLANAAGFFYERFR